MTGSFLARYWRTRIMPEVKTSAQLHTKPQVDYAVERARRMQEEHVEYERRERERRMELAAAEERARRWGERRRDDDEEGRA